MATQSFDMDSDDEDDDVGPSLVRQRDGHDNWTEFCPLPEDSTAPPMSKVRHGVWPGTVAVV